MRIVNIHLIYQYFNLKNQIKISYHKKINVFYSQRYSSGRILHFWSVLSIFIFIILKWKLNKLFVFDTFFEYIRKSFIILPNVVFLTEYILIKYEFCFCLHLSFQLKTYLICKQKEMKTLEIRIYIWFWYSIFIWQRGFHDIHWTPFIRTTFRLSF